MKRLITILIFGWSPAFSQQALPFLPGEELTYSFEFGPFDAALATVSVEKSRPHGDWIFHVQGKTMGKFRWIFAVDDFYTSTVNAHSGWPMVFERDISEGGYALRQTYHFNWSDSTVHTASSRGDGPVKKDIQKLSQPGHDMVSGLFALRSMDWSAIYPGDTIQVGLFMDEEWFDLKLIHQGIDQVEAGGKIWPSIALQPVVQTGRIWRRSDDLRVHISNDGRYIPLLAETRILFGKIRMELTHASGLRNPAMVNQ